MWSNNKGLPLHLLWVPFLLRLNNHKTPLYYGKLHQLSNRSQDKPKPRNSTSNLIICKYYYRHAGRYCTRTWHRCSWVSSNIVTNFDMNQVTCKCWGSFSANSYWQPFPKRNRCPKLLKDKSILCSTLLFRWSCVQTVKENSHPPAEQDGIAESMFPSQC